MNENLNSLGYGSLFFVYNMGTLLISIAAIPLLAFLSYILGLMKEHSSLANRQYLRLSKLLYWDYILGTFFESYSVICMCVAINLTHLTYEKWGGICNSVLVFAFAAFCLLFPVVVAAIMWLKFPELWVSKVRRQLGSLYEGLDLEKGR